ncbi:ankyrin [Ascobolus immersus RN42]|uniref:Ankyrin n=1 Tax=Ascobolus immersus RN42 TaxID=1160509 RepID=A0A3N4IS37_ASCIM|nr:ankyrin [Ascobolus immersus RN42]
MDPDKYPLHKAIQLGKIAEVDSLLLAHPELANKPDDDERLPIHWAATTAGTTGSLDLLNKLSQAQGKKFDIDAVDSLGWSILHIGASLGEKPGGEEVVTWAIARGGDVSLKNNNGQTPLHLAASKSALETARLLLAAGAKAAVKDKTQQALPLHRASAVGSMPMVNLLLEHKSPVNATDVDGWTSLHHAVAEGNADIAVALLKAGADATKEDPEKTTPLDLAPDRKVLKYIQDAAKAEGIELPEPKKLPKW